MGSSNFLHNIIQSISLELQNKQNEVSKVEIRWRIKTF